MLLSFLKLRVQLYIQTPCAYSKNKYEHCILKWKTYKSKDTKKIDKKPSSIYLLTVSMLNWGVRMFFLFHGGRKTKEFPVKNSWTSTDKNQQQNGHTFDTQQVWKLSASYIIIKFEYDTCCHWLNERALSEYKTWSWAKAVMPSAKFHQRSGEKHSTMSPLSPYTSLVLKPVSACFTTEQSTVKTSLFVT